MVGNDIIDIALAAKESDFTNPRVMEKIYSKKEQQFIVQSSQPIITSLMFWSMKESAYKLYIQIHQQRFFRPDQFECFIEKNQAIVSYKNFTSQLKVQLTSNFIFSQATLKSENISHDCFTLTSNNYDIQSAETTQKLCYALAAKWALPKKDLTILKSATGIPSIYFGDKRLNNSISLTHHGNYGAYSVVN